MIITAVSLLTMASLATFLALTAKKIGKEFQPGTQEEQDVAEIDSAFNYIHLKLF